LCSVSDCRRRHIYDHMKTLCSTVTNLRLRPEGRRRRIDDACALGRGRKALACFNSGETNMKTRHQHCRSIGRPKHPGVQRRRESETDRQKLWRAFCNSTDRQSERETETEIDRQTEWERQRQTEIDRQTDRDIERETEKDSERVRETERDRQIQGERETARGRNRQTGRQKERERHTHTDIDRQKEGSRPTQSDADRQQFNTQTPNVSVYVSAYVCVCLSVRVLTCAIISPVCMSVCLSVCLYSCLSGSTRQTDSIGNSFWQLFSSGGFALDRIIDTTTQAAAAADAKSSSAAASIYVCPSSEWHRRRCPGIA